MKYAMLMSNTASSLKKHHGLIASWVDPFMQLRVTGLDISDLSMKYFAFNRVKKDKLAVRHYGEIRFSEGMIANGEIKDEKKLGEILGLWFQKEKKKIVSPFVSLSLPEEKSFIRAVQIPKVKHEDIANAIRWEIENQIPLPLNEVNYDYEVIDPVHDDQDHLDVIITAFPKEILNMYVRVIRAAGMTPYAIELESQSLVRACAPSLCDTEAKIVLDVGRTRTSLVIYAAGAILYTSTIDAGGLVFEQHIMRQINVEQPEAQRIKIEVGLDKTIRRGEVFSALAPVITIISDELVRAISYYQSHSAHTHGATQNIETILMSGGDANLRGLDTYLSSVLKIPVEKADPFAVIKDQMTSSIPPFTKKEALAYAIPIGLALRDIRL